MSITEQTALQIAAVWGSVSLIADSIATLPVQQWRQVGSSEDDVQRIDQSQVIAQPWSEITRRDFVTQGTVSLLLRGNLWGRYVGIDPISGWPDQVQLVHPDNASARRATSGQVEVRYWGQNVSPDRVTRAMGLTVPEGIQGLSPIQNLRCAMGLARAQDLYGESFFANSARPDGTIEVPDDLNSDETKAMLTGWLQAHQGTNRAHLPAILTGGAKFNPITMSMADAQFLEMMNYSASVISGLIYRVPPHMLGMTDKATSWGAGIEQQELGYVRNTLLIWLNRWEDLMTSWLPRKQFVTFDLSQRLRGDTLQRWSAYQIARVIGAMSNAEVRKAEGMPQVTDPALEAFDQPFNSSPMKPPSSSGVGPGGDKAD